MIQRLESDKQIEMISLREQKEDIEDESKENKEKKEKVRQILEFIINKFRDEKNLMTFYEVSYILNNLFKRKKKKRETNLI